MIVSDLVSRAGANLLATYLALGRELPGAEVRETDGYVALLSDVAHPSGNFASRLRLDPWSAGELRDLASSRAAFQAIALPDDGPPHLAELLQRAGFEEVLRFVTMVATPAPSETSLEMTECRDEAERRRVGRFMADAFFAREDEATRRTMATAMGRADALSVYYHAWRDRPLAAVALAREADMIGIYNLCVGGPARGKGHGTALVRWCLAFAASERLPVCLQCVPSLEPWYARQGFERVGAVGVWCLR